MWLFYPKPRDAPDEHRGAFAARYMESLPCTGSRPPESTIRLQMSYLPENTSKASWGPRRRRQATSGATSEGRSR